MVKVVVPDVPANVTVSAEVDVTNPEVTVPVDVETCVEKVDVRVVVVVLVAVRVDTYSGRAR